MSILPDGETIRAVITLAPPTIQDAQIQAAVAAGLHAAGARSFERPARRIQPNVASRYHLPGNVHIVVFNEDQVPLQITVFAQVNDVLNVAFAVIIARMRLPGENKLHGPGTV